jgi:hypothetical protein
MYRQLDDLFQHIGSWMDGHFQFIIYIVASERFDKKIQLEERWSHSINSQLCEFLNIIVGSWGGTVSSCIKTEIIMVSFSL